jgi:signal transduction histidine kinase
MSIAVRAPRFDRGRVVQWIRTESTRYVLEVALLAGLYYGAAKVGFAFNFAGPVAAIVWLPAGVGIAYLYLRGLQFWPGMLIGDLFANDYTAVPIGSALGQTIGNVLEVVLAAYLLRRLDRDRNLLESVDGVARMLVPVSVATTISASVGSIALRLGHVITSDAIPAVWRTWWLGDACGALLVVPLAIAWSRPINAPVTRRRVLEAILILATTAALSDVATRTHRPLAYLVFPVLIWAALRFGQRGATLAVLVVVSFTVWNTTHLAGPFYFHDITRSVLETQLFIAVAALSALCLAAIVSEREQFAERLGESRAQLFKAADAERQRIERNLHDGAQQRLLALAVHLRLAAEQARRDPEHAAVMIEDAEGELQVAFDELRELSQGIHPTVLTDLGLANAIRSVAARSAQTITLRELPTQRVEIAVEATGYFVFMEAVSNAQKYAYATTIQVQARVSERTLWIEVVDDGVGGATESLGSGLRGLRDRVEGVGGTFRVVSRIGDGTRIWADIPRSMV